MADITVKFRQGDPITFTGAPDDVTQMQALQRVFKDYPGRADSVTAIEGAKPSSLGERLKYFATEGQIGEHGVLTSDLPQLLYGVADSLTFGQTAGQLPEPKTQAEKDSRMDGRELMLAAGPKTIGGQPMLRPPNFSGGSWVAASKARAAQLAAAAKKAGAATPAASGASTTAQSVLNSPWFKMVAKAAGYGTAAELARAIYNHLAP